MPTLLKAQRLLGNKQHSLGLAKLYDSLYLPAQLK